MHSGRTPGKRRMGLRTVKLDGTPVDFPASTLRNLLRLLDWLPGFYGLGVLAIFCTSAEQRLGDLTAGTVVIRERTTTPGTPVEAAAGERAHAAALLERVNVRLTVHEAEAIRRLLQRLPGMEPSHAARLMERLARRVREKLHDPDGVLRERLRDPDRRAEALALLLAAHAERERGAEPTGDAVQ